MVTYNYTELHFRIYFIPEKNRGLEVMNLSIIHFNQHISKYVIINNTLLKTDELVKSDANHLLPVDFTVIGSFSFAAK